MYMLGDSNRFACIYAVTYRCFVAECADADLDAPDVMNTTFAINDGERVCCRSGKYRSWTNDADRQSCNLCPVTGEFILQIYLLYS